jgi:Flp pilus assembly protein TadG
MIHDTRCMAKDRGGQVLVILALAIAGLLAVSALAVDVLHMYWQKNRLQAGVDAAALAGATYLGPTKLVGNNPACGFETVAQNAACSYALMNEVVRSEIQTIAVSTDKRSLTITAARDVPATFARILGYESFPVQVLATAVLRVLQTAEKVLPVGLDARTPWVEGQTITMHVHDYSKSDCGAGCWQGIVLASRSGGSVFRDNLEYGCNCTLSLGAMVTNEPGAKTGPTQGLQQRIDTAASQFPGDTSDSHALADLRASVVPLIQWTGCGGRCTGDAGLVIGFAEVWLVSVSGSDINAIFIRQVAPGEPGSGGTDTGAVHPTLLQ